MNHRFGEGAWSQGDSNERARVTLQIPADAQTSPEALSLWLRSTQNLDAQVIRKGPPGGGKEGAKKDGAPKGDKKPDVPKWTLSGGSASDAWSMEYTPGNASAEVKHTQHSTLASFNRLHKAVGGGIGWTILADSFAIAMLLLGLSGIWMWARGRNAKELVVSVLGVSVVVMLVVLVPALF